MKTIKTQVSAALAASLALSATPALASSASDRRAALDEIREMREDTRTVTASEMPALREAMALESPSASRVASVLRSRTPTGRLFVKFVTEPNPDVATTDAHDLVEEIFSNRGKPSEKLFLTKTNIQSLEAHGLYDTPIRAKVSLLDTMIVDRLQKDRSARLAAGDLVILAVASGFALHAGFNGTNRTAAALREVNWKGLPGEAQAAASDRASQLVKGGRDLASRGLEVGETGARAVATGATVGFHRAVRAVAKPTSKAAVQSEVDVLYHSFKQHLNVTPVVRQALHISEDAVKTTEYLPSQIEGLSIGLDKFSEQSTRVVFRKEHVEDQMRHVVTYVSEPVPHDEAHQLLALFSETKPLKFFPLGAKGSLRAASAEISEASDNAAGVIEEKAHQAGDAAKGAAAGARAKAERARANVAEKFKDFDRTAALLEGSKIGAVGIIAWHAGNAYGFDDGQDHAVTYLEDQIPQDRLQPVEMTPPAH